MPVILNRRCHAGHSLLEKYRQKNVYGNVVSVQDLVSDRSHIPSQNNHIHRNDPLNISEVREADYIPGHHIVMTPIPLIDFPSAKVEGKPDSKRIVLIRRLIEHYRLDRVSSIQRYQHQNRLNRIPDDRIIMDVCWFEERPPRVEPMPHLYSILHRWFFSFYNTRTQNCTSFCYRECASMTEESYDPSVPSIRRLQLWEKGLNRRSYRDYCKNELSGFLTCVNSTLSVPLGSRRGSRLPAFTDPLRDIVCGA